jgi:GST-like protein
VLELFTAPTTNGLRATIMLEELGVAYRAHAVEIGGASRPKPAALLKVNAAGTIPTLIDYREKISISQSFAIMQYLGEREGRFVGHDLGSRASIAQWMSFVMTDIISATHPIFVLSVQLKDTPKHIIEHYEERLIRYLRLADTQLERNPYLTGSEISIADLALFPTAHFRLPLIQKAEGTLHLQRWLEEIGRRPGVQRGMAVPPPADDDTSIPQSFRRI